MHLREIFVEWMGEFQTKNQFSSAQALLNITLKKKVLP